MRIDAMTYPGRKWLVWHVPRARELRDVLWIDDQSHTYCVIDRPLRTVGNDIARRVEQARKIVINCDSAVALVDPIEGVSDESITVAAGQPIEA